jgi:nitroreductase
MEFYEAVNRRRTVREFQPTPIEEEKITRILEAGLKAPANAHLREWHFLLLRDPENRRKALVGALKARDLRDKKGIEELVNKFEYEELKDVYRKALPIQLTMMLEAPELLVVCYRMKKPLGEVKNLFELNNLASVWCCIENIVLAMAAEGIYGCTYSPYETTGLKEYLGIPKDYEVATLIPFGYPRHPPGEGETPRLNDRLHIDRW